jgi:hypothetical protein
MDRVVGMDVALPGATPPSKYDLTTALGLGGLIVEQRVTEMVSRRVIADILDRQETTSRNGYRDEATKMREMADEVWRKYQAQISLTNPPTQTADVLIDQDCVILPSGTSP